MTYLPHPTACLLSCLLLALALPALSPFILFSLGVLLACGLFVLQGKVLFTILWRLKWLLLSVFLMLAWSVPGQALFASWWAPTDAGLRQGTEQVARLWILVCLMRGVFLLLGRQGVLLGLYGLLRPIAALGLPVSRMTLRLGLTMDYAEQLLAQPRRFSWAHWQSLFQLKPDDNAIPTQLILAQQAWRYYDSLFLLVYSGLLALALKV